jgi:hypothetical protein
VLFENDRLAKKIRLLFHGKILIFYYDGKWIGLLLGRFFQNQSGHPGHGSDTTTRSRTLEKSAHFVSVCREQGDQMRL